MSDLLLMQNIPTPKKVSYPLWWEFKIDAELSPVLISSSTKFLWVDKHKDIVRSGFRNREKNIELGIIREIAKEAKKREWGSLCATVQEAEDYIRFYFEDLELETLTDEKWIPEGVIVVCPKDRSFLGTIIDSKDHCSVMVHNAARGIAFAGNTELLFTDIRSPAVPAKKSRKRSSTV